MSTKTDLACMHSGPPSWKTSIEIQPGFDPGALALEQRLDGIIVRLTGWIFL